MTKEELQNRYNQYFSEEDKAKAFDKIAERYYFANFGTMAKTDMETLLFSIYLEQILEQSEPDIDAYSDYRLSKILGIPQTKVSSLKVKKELAYPYQGFDWRESLARFSSRAVYEKQRIKLFLPDRNLYLEVKNAIETNGGFVEVQLTQNLLQVRVEYFLDLMVALSPESDRAGLRTELWNLLKQNMRERDQDIAGLEKESFGQALKGQLPELIIDLLGECIPLFGGAVKKIAGHVYKSIQSARA